MEGSSINPQHGKYLTRYPIFDREDGEEHARYARYCTKNETRDSVNEDHYSSDGVLIDKVPNVCKSDF